MPAYLLGVAFSFTFCPTLFWLFFGLTIPLAIASRGGLLFPGLLALGTMLPVLGLAALLASGTVNVRQFVRRTKTADVWLQRIVGAVFVLIGLNEMVLYWFLCAADPCGSRRYANDHDPGCADHPGRSARGRPDERPYDQA